MSIKWHDTSLARCIGELFIPQSHMHLYLNVYFPIPSRNNPNSNDNLIFHGPIALCIVNNSVFNINVQRKPNIVCSFFCNKVIKTDILPCSSWEKPPRLIVAYSLAYCWSEPSRLFSSGKHQNLVFFYSHIFIPQPYASPIRF